MSIILTLAIKPPHNFNLSWGFMSRADKCLRCGLGWSLHPS
jgi:hypothetical protein